jgi:hypothetical protein
MDAYVDALSRQPEYGKGPSLAPASHPEPRALSLQASGLLASGDVAERIKRGQHWLDWMYIAEGLEVGRVKAMRRAGTNRPIGAAYNRAFGDWLNERPWARDIDKPTRNHLFWCADNRNAIEACPRARESNVLRCRSIEDQRAVGRVDLELADGVQHPQAKQHR